MKFTETSIHGVYIIETESVVDERGVFFRTFCKEDFLKINFQKEFVQMNHSVNFKKGTFRGFHYQQPPFAESKLIRCIAGSVYDMVVDIRKGSKTFLNFAGVELSRDNKMMILIPEGCAHGFQTLEDNSEMIYHHTNYYTKNADKGINYNDPLLKIKLPLAISIISEKDNSYPFLIKNFEGLNDEM